MGRQLALAFSLAFEKLAAMTRLAAFSIALPCQFRGSWRVLALKRCTASFAFYCHGFQKELSQLSLLQENMARHLR